MFLFCSWLLFVFLFDLGFGYFWGVAGSSGWGFRGSDAGALDNRVISRRCVVDLVC